jgi:hypothetical protein
VFLLEKGEKIIRKEKEDFIREAWEKFKDPNDRFTMPNLSFLDEDTLDSMITYYKYLSQ